MKKAFYMMAAAAIALSSCSSEETTDVAKSSLITLRPTVGLNSRGAEFTTKSLNSMWVSAFYQSNGTAYFEDQRFDKEPNNNHSTFIPEAPQYWQEGRTYKFVAIAPAKTDWPAGLTITKDKVSCDEFAPKADIKDQKDLIITASDAGANKDQGHGVPLELKHILSQIQIKVKNSNKNLVYNIAGIRIKKVVNKNKFEYSTTTNQTVWGGTDAQTKGDYTWEFDEVVKLDGVTDVVNLTHKKVNEEGGAMLIPQTITSWDGKPAASSSNVNDGAYISLLLNVKTKTGTSYMYPVNAQGENTYGWVAIPIPNTEWAEGNKYIYTLDMSTGCGKVDPVDPGKDVNPGGTVSPDKEKDPALGENVFGQVIRFQVSVKDWNTTDNGFEIDASTGKEPVKPGAKK